MDRHWEDSPWRSRSWIGAAWNENSDDWGYTESDDAMGDPQHNEVLVDHQTYTSPPGLTPKQWANHEKAQSYITMAWTSQGWREWCRLCAKFGECDSHYTGQEHLRHLSLPTEIYNNPDLWKIPQTREGQLTVSRGPPSDEGTIVASLGRPVGH